MKHELVDFARSCGASATGDKPELAARITAILGGRVPAAPARRAVVSRQLAEPLTLDTHVPPRQASSQQLRRFLVEHIGPSFFYDIHIRTYLASENAKTLRDVVAHWHATRDASKPETPAQLELVRFNKVWHLANPAGTAVECRAAWRIHKSLPIDERPHL
jgi:Domain of unknown function (DUF6434)/SAP domain-containing new25